MGEAFPDPKVAPPDPSGYFHATSGESTTLFGCEGVINVWTPYMENSSGHSIMQTGMQNYDRPQLQSLEAGWEVSHDQYGNWSPHLFTYYTTNGYTNDGNNIGGYNQDVDGWVQYDSNISPGALLLGTSTAGGPQLAIEIKFQLFNQNWWFQANGRWIGYYPASLFLDPLKPGTTLGDHADWLGFWGEVYSSESDPNTTTTWMGSGELAEVGWARACFQINLRRQSNANGTMADHNGTASAENSDYYDIITAMSSGTSWGSYFWAGGPGDVSFEHRILEVGTTFLPETDGTWLMADWDRDGIPDLVFVKTANTPSGRIEVHIASGKSNYQTRVLEVATTFGNETDGTWLMADWDRDGIPDLVFIKTANTPSGRVEVHIASGKSNYQTRVLEVATTFGNETDGTWLMADWDRDGIPDLVFVKTNNTGTGRVEVHIASGASNYLTRIVERGTTFLPETGGTWLLTDWNRDGIPDLIFIKTSALTGTGKVEVHIASGKKGG